MEKTILAVLLLLTVAVLTAADDGSYQADAAKITKLSNLFGSSSKSLKEKLICLERKLKVVNQCEKMLANVKGCNEGDYNVDNNLCNYCDFLQVVYSDCKDAYAKGERTSRVYTINPDYGEPFKVYCNMNTDGGGWTVIQRQKGSNNPNFNRNWNDYVNGFGNPNYDHWLGLEKIHRLTKANSMLRVELVSYTKGNRYARYNVFKVGSSSTSYTLTASSYSGNAGNSLKYNSGRKFSTKDRDNDKFRGNCATSFHGGWWFGHCTNANLNGILVGSRTKGTKYCTWNHLDGSYCLKSAEMKIRRK